VGVALVYLGTLLGMLENAKDGGLPLLEETTVRTYYLFSKYLILILSKKLSLFFCNFLKIMLYEFISNNR
jgi:hypothetical protein